MNRIEINFTECSPAPPGGYSVIYREKGTLDALVSAGIFYSTPAIFFDTTHPDGTLFEGFISSVFPGLTCNQIPWEQGGSGSSSSGSSPINIAGTILNSPHGIFVILADPAPCDVTFPIDGTMDVGGTPTDFSADVTVLTGATTGQNLAAASSVITCIKPTTAGQTTYVYSALCGSTIYTFTLEIDNPC